MKTLTLEWNAVITWETPGRVGRESLGKLIALHGKRIDVGIVTTAASENTSLRKLPETADAFDDRLSRIGWSHLTKVLTACEFDLTYFDYCFFTPNDYEEIVSELWELILPANIPYEATDFARERGIDSIHKITSDSYQKWRNKWCDVHSLYAHLMADRDIFVSGDIKNFKGDRRGRLADLGIKSICTYDEALEEAVSH